MMIKHMLIPVEEFQRVYESNAGKSCLLYTSDAADE